MEVVVEAMAMAAVPEAVAEGVVAAVDIAAVGEEAAPMGVVAEAEASEGVVVADLATQGGNLIIPVANLGEF